jgi:hypothetical protein
MRAAQTSTVDKHAALFEHCDIFIDTDDDAWTFIAANPKARAVVDAAIDAPINWNFGTPLQEWWTCAPSDWRAVDLNFRTLEQEDRLSRLPKLSYVGTNTHRYTLQVGIAAKTAGLRVVAHDEKTGWQTINLQDDDNVIDFASAREAITRHRPKTHGYVFPNIERQSSQFDPSIKLIDQKVTLPGLPGGPPLVPSLPVVSFENGHLSGGADVLERIVRNNKAERVLVENAGDGKIRFTEPPPKPKLEFPSGLPLFELAPDVCCTMSIEDRIKTLQGMARHGLLHLPFPQIAVRVWMPDIAADIHGEVATTAPPRKLPNWFLTCIVGEPLSIHEDGTVGVMEERLIELDDGRGWKRVLNLDSSKFDEIVHPAFTREQIVRVFEQYITASAVTLVTSLANRLTVEASPTERNTRFKNPHKQPKPQFRSATGAIYISLTRVQRPPVEDMLQEPGTHASPTPHERCGHNHTVLFGVGRRERRVQWFPPVWVNGPRPDDYQPRKRIVQA